MARSVVKICKTCGTAFDSPLVGGRVSSTVNCPKHRSSAKMKKSAPSSDVNRSYMQKFTCKTCGKTMSKGDALRHRRDTGHQF